MKKKFEGIIKGLLSPEQAKQIMGSYGEGDEKCGYRVYINGEEQIACNVSRSVAKSMVENWGGNWCCQCETTTYCSGY